jgi:hypothetical protein
MTIETEINRIKQNIADCYTTLTAKGATIPAVENVANLAACIRTIPATVEENFVTQSGDTIVTSAGTPLAIDGISSLTTAPSITDAQLTFADDGNSTVSFSMQQLKDYVSPAPATTTLHQYDRVDGKATVADFWTDGNGQRYAVCVVDAAYRSGSTMIWGRTVDTLLPDYPDFNNAYGATESGTYNTDTILNNYTPTDYPAFNFARNACTVTVDNKTFVSCLPNFRELYRLRLDKVTLDTYDPTLSNYSSRSLTNFRFGGAGAWSSNEYNSNYAWCLGPSDYGNGVIKSSQSYGVCPVIEIPVDENGTVITI